MAPPAAPTPPGARPKGKLPLWAWLAAGAVGLLVGFFLLRQQAPQAEDAEAEDEDTTAASARGTSGTAVVEPLTEDELGALGLRGSYQVPGSGEGGGGGGDGFSAESGSGFTSETSFASQLLSPAHPYTGSPAPGLAAPAPAPTYQGGALGAGPRSTTTTAPLGVTRAQ